MGAWGAGIRQDDLVCDVIGEFEDLLKSGKDLEGATKAVKAKFAAAMQDSRDDGPLVWIALADMQWTYGGLEPQVLKRVKADFNSGRSLAAWAEDPRGLSRRRAVLQKFITTIEQPKRQPKRLPKAVVRAPKFQPGDCLSIKLPNDQYGAALVLAAEHSIPELGKNLVGVLDYFARQKPATEIFRQRKWLTLNKKKGFSSGIDIAWYYDIGFRAIAKRLEVVGRVEITASDPKDSNIYRRWTGIGELPTGDC